MMTYLRHTKKVPFSFFSKLILILFDSLQMEITVLEMVFIIIFSPIKNFEEVVKLNKGQD